MWDEAGRKTRGRVSSIFGEEVVVTRRRRWFGSFRSPEELVFGADSITRVDIVDSTWNGALIGAAIAPALVYGIWRWEDNTFPDSNLKGAGTMLVGGMGAFLLIGSSHKCMHDFAPGRSATAVGRRCGCARAGTQRCSRLSLSRRPPARAPLLVGGPARRQPDQTQAADAMALTWRRTEKASGRGLDFRRRSTLEPNPSLTVQPPWNWQPRHDSAGWCGRIFREPATPPQIQTVLVGHVSH